MDEFIRKSDILAEIETAIMSGRLSTVNGTQLYRWVLQINGLRTDGAIKEQDEFDTLANYVGYLRSQAMTYKALASFRLRRLQTCMDTLDRIKEICAREIIE